MIGTTVDRFRITALLGYGGMGSVWKAEDTLLHRPVALKLLDEPVAGAPEGRRRFLREARAASSLSHPCVATVYGAGESGPHVYIALALIDGETVADCVRRAPFAFGDVLRLGIAVAEALDHAHGRGVIHRDITSRNIMIDREGRVFVLDFGLALMVDRTRLTQPDSFMGTAAYLAPEVALGRDADPRADLYGLGVVLYEALTGTLPFRGERAESLIFAAVNEAPEPPGSRRAGVPDAIERIVMRLLEKSPDARYPSAEALIAALREAAGLHPGVRVGPVAVGATAVPVQAPTRERAVALAPFRDLSERSELGGAPAPLAGALTDVVRAALAQTPGAEVLAVPDAHATLAPTLAIEHARGLGARLLLTGSLRRLGERIRLAYALLDVTSGGTIAGETIDGRADDQFALEDRLVASVRAAVQAARPAGCGAAPGDAGASHQSFLQALACLQRTDDGAAIEHAIALLEPLRAGQPDSASIQTALARAYGRMYTLRSERAWEIKAADACQRALALDPHAPEVFATRGDLHAATGRNEDAIASYLHAIELRPEFAEAWSGLAFAYLRTNRFADAEEACRRVIALRPNDWIGYTRLGIVFFRQGRFAHAVEPWRMVTRLAPDNAVGHSNLAGAYFHSDRWDEAAAEYRRALAIKPTAESCAGLGSVLYYRGEYQAALEAFEQAVAMQPRDPRGWGNLASACDQCPGYEARGAEALDRAISLMLERLEINPQVAEDWALLAKWRADRGQPEEARTAIERALALAPEDASVMGEAVVVYHTLADRARALRWVREAVAHGYGSEVLERNPALAALREDPAYRKIVEERPATPAGTAQHTEQP